MLTAEPSSVPAPVSSRRIGAGVRPPPGATSRRPAWWGAADWIEVEVRGAVAARRDLCRVHHVDPDTVVAVARGMAGFADFRTGRNCRPTNARLVALPSPRPAQPTRTPGATSAPASRTSWAGPPGT